MSCFVHFSHTRVRRSTPVFVLTVSTTGGGHGHVLRQCSILSFNHGFKTRACLMPVLLWQFRPRPCHTTVATCRFPCWENFSLFSHGLSHTHVLGRVGFRKPAFHDSVSYLVVVQKSTWQAVQSEFRALRLMIVDF
ncbi:hypothetical protein GOBAR_AA34005 [Gossypium barbadense]|uniref:Uncharacterized protein n=1 Tax=Gossypium barbadense TaxID=3634 RepID=A0A2P5W6F5_GOSBA|nr:hypothetical protein GOBAR_AA34005 [Gossypium barbadense]